MNRPIPDRTSLARPSRGAAMVEFAIVLPLLMLITFGVLELGVAFIEDITLNKSVREASRYIAHNWNIAGCYRNIGSDIVQTNMNDIFVGSIYNDFDIATDSVTIEHVCVNETTGAVGATELVNATCTGTTAICDPDPATHHFIRTTAVYQHKLMLPGLQIGQWQINYAPNLRAVSMMRVLN